MIPIWRGGTLSFIARLGFRVRLSPSSVPKQFLSFPLTPRQLIHTPESLLAAYHATPAQALRIHSAVRARHSLAMHFATFAGSDVEALDPIAELEQAKREMATDPQGNGESLVVGDWRAEGGMGIIDVGETAVVQIVDDTLHSSLKERDTID
jgi:N-acyl-phosphatidylethanolamine-hydrolysing phospholipase D